MANSIGKRAYAGNRVVAGFRGDVAGPLDPEEPQP